MAETAAGNPSEESLRGAQSPPLPPDSLIIVPVRGMVLFPGTVLPIALARPRSVMAAQRAVREQKPVGIIMQRDAGVDDPLPVDLHRMGTVANIVRYITAPDGTHHLVCQGEQRFRIVEYLTGWPFFVAETVRIPEPAASSDEIEARFINLKSQAVEAVQLLPQAPNELLMTIQGIDSPGALADLVATFMDATPDEKQEILETVDVGARLEKVSRTPRASDRGSAAVAGDRPRNQGVARRPQPRGAAARADGGHSAPARRGGRGKDRRNRRTRKGDQQREYAQGSRGPGPQGAAPPAAHAGSRRRIRDGADLSRLAGRLALGPSRGGADRHRRGAPHPRSGPFRSREDQAPDHRISGRPQAGAGRQGADPVLRRPSRASARRRSVSRSRGR